MARQKKPQVTLRSDGRYALHFGSHYICGKTPEEVIKKRDKILKDEQIGLQTSQNPTVAAYATKWLPVNKAGVSERTYACYCKLLEDLLDVIGSKQMQEVVPSDIKDVYFKHFLNYSKSYISKAKNLYIAIFDSAVDDGICLSNPARAKSAKPHEGTEGSHRAITDEEREIILRTDNRLRPVLLLMLYAGLRNSEALAIDIDRDIDFEKKIITLHEFRHLGVNKAFTSGKGKTKFAVRTIKLFPELEEALKGKHGNVILNKNGEILSDTSWREAWKAYVNQIETALNGCQKRWYGKRKCDRDIELPPWKNFTVRPYDLRHSFCTWCRDKGISIHVVQSWMGHSDLTMISKIYYHLSDETVEQEFQKAIKKAAKKTAKKTKNSLKKAVSLAK